MPPRRDFLYSATELATTLCGCCAGHSREPVTPLPGSTPTAVNLTAVWNAGDLKAHLTGPATTDARVVSYEVRACFGTRYRTQDESVIGNVGAGNGTFRDRPGPRELGRIRELQGLHADGHGEREGQQRGQSDAAVTRKSPIRVMRRM